MSQQTAVQEREHARPYAIMPRRPVKVQVCLTEQERAQLSARAKAAGFEAMADYVRARTLGNPAGVGVSGA